MNKVWIKNIVIGIVLGVLITACNNSPTSTIDNITVTPSSSTLMSTSSTLVLAEVIGTGTFDKSVKWISTSGILSATSGSFITFTAPNVITSTTVTITASSLANPSKAATTSITVNPVPINSSVTSTDVTATSATLSAGESTAISAVVVGTNNPAQGVTWNIVSGGGTLDAATGSPIHFVVPNVSSVTSVIIRATSVQDPSKSGTVTITVNPAPLSISQIALNASRVALREGETSILSAEVSGTGAFNSGVIWTLEAGSIGSISSSTGKIVFYDAPSTSFGRVVRVTATSIQDSSVKKTIFMSVNPNKASIAGGEIHSLALKSDGTLLSWGGDIHGELGDDDKLVSSSTPVVVSGATGIVAIATGRFHSLALKSDGTVLSWGSDFHGELGDGGVGTYQPTPVPAVGVTGVIAIAASGYHSLALKSDGTLISWGDTTYFNGGKNTPTTVNGVTGIIAIAAGYFHNLALKSDGTMVSWGSDAHGQLGDDTALIDKSVPVVVGNATGIIAVAAGNYHSLALKSDGTMLSWGEDGNGQLGDNVTLANKPIPVSINGVSGIVNIAAGGVHSLALKSDNTMLRWGYKGFGLLGVDDQPIPVAVSDATGIVAIAAGLYHSLALKSDGTMLSWGAGIGLGDGDSTFTNKPTPVPVALGIGVTIRLP